MATSTTRTNKPILPRGNDQSPKGYNRAALYSGKALDFDGVNDTLKGSEPFSYTNHAISANFSTSSASSYKIVFDGRDGGADGPLITIEPGNRLKYQINGVATTEYIVTADEWYNVVGVYDGTSQSIYINGQLWETKTNSGSVSVTTNWSVGVRSFSSEAAWFDGMIGGVKAYSTALTAAQVADLYNNPEKIVPTGVDNDALKLWLPMQEGAGTTAYDGSGNGNHGAVSGASWLHGIGAPVSQTAVIDWNKGVNLTPNSEDFGLWILNFVTVTTNDTTAPDGQSTADKIIVDSNNNFHRIYRQSFPNTTTNDLAFSVYLKYNDHQYVSFGLTDDSSYRAQLVVDLIGGTITFEQTDNANVVSSSLTDVGNGWYKLEGVITPTTAWGNNIYTMLMFQNDSTFSSAAFTSSGTSVYAWGAQAEFASNNGPYVLTFNASQDNEVLLPAGLTTGRDITGVNLFENVRKQGALNLDGNSWAEVHDNASLDITPAMTMECWVDFSKINSSTIRHFIVKPSGATWTTPYARYALRASNAEVQWWFESAGYLENHLVSLTGWNHFAVTKDGTAENLYVNGSQVDSNVGNATITTSEQNLLLGQATQGVEPLDSQIAQPRIYNRALTAEEVARNYNAGKNTYTND